MAGFVFFGMLIGAVSSCYWVMTGGSFLVAFALYSLVAAAFVLLTAISAYLWSEFRAQRTPGRMAMLPAAE